ncbi:transcriptional regulator NrdR [Helicovermis profundi]|uniref:Transcriptional repressor NrdR n=1 Tax=Helicovermis profundi TaxID=3065157 RepID=A0AAU9EFG8_9FIRM|nr:transcriptional regulator NrdR [Clostridia bacterium S502]
MNCPYCSYTESKVVDSRPTDEGHSIRRRRECSKCKRRFTTYEKIEETPLIVVKKDGTRELYDKKKLLNGIIRACEKRPVSIEQMEKLIDKVELKLHNTMDKEIHSTKIGELVIDLIKDLDEVAYVRFASVYRQFKDINSFIDELTKLLNEKNN